MRNRRITTVSLCLAIILCAPLSAIGGKMYRWVDDEGVTHFTSTIPPEYANKERILLDKDGYEIERVDAAKTKEEHARDKELKRLRAEKQKIIEAQQASDRVLLRTFRSEDDIKMARDGKFTAINVHMQVIRSNIKRLKGRLEGMQKNAANIERQGRKVGEASLNDMSVTRQQIKDAYASIIVKERDKDRIWEKHETDLQRFRKLKKLQPEKPGISPSQQASSLLETVVACTNQPACDSIWELAKAYLQKHATTRVQMASKIILMTAMPVQNNEFGLTVSRIAQKDGDGTEIFLDLQCKNTQLGDELCDSDKITDIRKGFQAALAQ
ncbi:hypothetical protein MNBD_GAMMA26-290 [hydrothermal vent metagenome]|uniref:DUF4124 domain-containing protein n=1 Tax=hydrothermal vent metagenome TaxID=652676 RepID=A0A3B1BC54_9ZZZZ